MLKMLGNIIGFCDTVKHNNHVLCSNVTFRRIVVENSWQEYLNREVEMEREVLIQQLDNVALLLTNTNKTLVCCYYYKHCLAISEMEQLPHYYIIEYIISIIYI